MLGYLRHTLCCSLLVTNIHFIIYFQSSTSWYKLFISKNDVIENCFFSYTIISKYVTLFDCRVFEKAMKQTVNRAGYWTSFFRSIIWLLTYPYVQFPTVSRFIRQWGKRYNSEALIISLLCLGIGLLILQWDVCKDRGCHYFLWHTGLITRRSWKIMMFSTWYKLCPIRFLIG